MKMVVWFSLPSSLSHLPPCPFYREIHVPQGIFFLLLWEFLPVFFSSFFLDVGYFRLKLIWRFLSYFTLIFLSFVIFYEEFLNFIFQLFLLSNILLLKSHFQFLRVISCSLSLYFQGILYWFKDMVLFFTL